MRFHLLAMILLAGAAVPATAQNNNLDRRVGKLEAEMRAVQRKVFPGGNVEPDIRPVMPSAEPMGVPASSAVADLTARVDALESQLQTLTGQAEENAYRLRQLEQALGRLRSETEGRLNALEAPAQTEPAQAALQSPAVQTAVLQTPKPQAAAPKPAAPKPQTAAPKPQPAAPKPSTVVPAVATADAADAQPSTDPVDEAYFSGFRLWEDGKFAEAQKALEAVAKKHPKHRRASWAQNLAGRAYLDEGKPATAAKLFLANYQANPRGERAADSLYFLGQALVKLKKPADACKVYDELQDVYGVSMRDYLKENLPKARSEAKCS